MGKKIVIADAHLGGLDRELDLFLSFLSFLQQKEIQALFILGDLFNIWLGTPKMQLTHQRLVIDALNSLRMHQIRLKYVEGNRDYFLSALYLEAPFHEIASEVLRENIGGKWFHFSHGDLVNIHDKPYRLWREFSRNRLIFLAFQCLPRSFAIRFSHFLEQKFRATNRKSKTVFPREACHEYAEKLWKAGNDVIVLGHFHEQRHHEFSFNDQKRDLYILPAWKDTHVYLEISEQGIPSFQQFITSTSP